MLAGVPTCFPGGVTNAAPGSFGARVPMPYPAQYYTWFDDFDRFDGAATGAHDWMLTAVGTSPVTVTDAANGQVLITTGSAADGNGASAQYAGMNTIATVAEVVESFKFTAGKELWFSTRFQISDATQSELMIGLAIADTTPLDATDGVFFYKADDATTLQLVSKIATPLSASANLLTVVAATWYEIGFHYNGVDTITAYLAQSDGTWNSVGSVGISALPTTELAVTFGFWTGTTAAKTALIDYIFAAQERA
jgi:hypothetical protein